MKPGFALLVFTPRLTMEGELGTTNPLTIVDAAAKTPSNAKPFDGDHILS